jgi:FkbM family methyltransferase
MNLIEALGRGTHPLHALRKSALYRGVTRKFDPIIRWRSPLLGRPIYLRLVSNASLIVDPKRQEDSVRQTLIAILAVLPRSAGGVFWDIGANIGLYTWYCAEARPDFHIVSFEPDKKNLECLRRTTASWGLTAHDIVPCAVAEQIGRTTFFIDEISRATGTIEPAAGTFNAFHYGFLPRGIEIETISLDHFITGGSRRPLVIKIDVEGAELRVLRGGQRLLAEHRPILLLEISGDRSRTLAFLEDLGYDCFDSDRRERVIKDLTVNVLALGRDLSSPVADALAGLGYPIAFHVP